MSSEIKTNTISEVTSANGVSIDGLNIKDSAINTGSIGSSVTGYTGIKAFQQFRLTSAKGNITSESDFTSNISEVSGGLNSHVTQSSGIFSFSSTGIYWVMLNISVSYDNESKYVLGSIKGETGSGYSKIARCVTNRFDVGSGDVESGAMCHTLFDVTDKDTHKIKFSVEAEDSTTFVASSTENRTYFTFLRIGDT